MTMTLRSSAISFLLFHIARSNTLSWLLECIKYILGHILVLHEKKNLHWNLNLGIFLMAHLRLKSRFFIISLQVLQL